MNVSVAHHSVRVGYIMAKLLEGRGSYEKYEIADFMILSMLHPKHIITHILYQLSSNPMSVIVCIYKQKRNMRLVSETNRGSYEKYEIADFMILSMLHDIGAYKTDDVRKQLTYEAKRTLPHSINSTA